MSKKIFKLSLVIVILAVFVSGCTLPWKKKAANNTTPGNSTATTTEDNLGTKQLKKFSDYDELRNFLQTNNSGNQGFSSNKSSVDPALINRIAGTDESDIVKTDGNYIYALVNNELKIIKADPAANAEIVSTITFKSRPENILINGTSLAVLGADDQVSNLDVYKSFRRQSPYTFFKVYDLSDPVNPSLVRDLDFEGLYTDARLVGDYVYLFTDSSSAYIEGEPVVPRVLDGGTVLSSDCAASEKCFAPDVFYFDFPYSSYNFFNITAINIKDNAEAISGQSYLVDYGQNLYVSPNNFYITYVETVNEYNLEQAVKRELVFSKLSADDQNKITAIEGTADYILSASEKKIKVSNIIDNYLANLSTDEQSSIKVNVASGLKQKLTEKSADMEKTMVYKFAFNGQHFEYRGLGEVSGQVLNQFSMDENGDYFRIATARGSIWSLLSDKTSEFYSSVFVLDNSLKVVGSLENLATTEKINTARFVGDRVYLATADQTSPLYVVNLNDPTKPAILGAIKVPGVSTYLYPINKDGSKLIGLGHDTEEGVEGNVKVKGLKISLFDFTDLAQPKELDSFIIGDTGSDSIAIQDHKSLLYSADKNLLALPAVLEENGKMTFSGSLVFNIDNNKFVLKGKIDHSDTVKRNFYLNNNVFTFSNKFVKINSLADLSSVKSLSLTSGGDDYIITPTPASSSTAQPPVMAPTENAATSTATSTAASTETSTSTSTSTSTNP